MKIAVAGLGRMGMQIARKLAENGHEVIAHNRSRDPVDIAVTYGVTAAYTKEDVVKAFNGEQFILWIMIPAEVFDAELDVWLSIMLKGSTIIDGGNSEYTDSRRRTKELEAKGLLFVGSGVSGGEEVQ